MSATTRVRSQTWSRNEDWSAEGQAAVADLDNFAGAGVTLLTGPSNQV